MTAKFRGVRRGLRQLRYGGREWIPAFAGTRGGVGLAFSGVGVFVFRLVVFFCSVNDSCFIANSGVFGESFFVVGEVFSAFWGKRMRSFVLRQAQDEVRMSG